MTTQNPSPLQFRYTTTVTSDAVGTCVGKGGGMEITLSSSQDAFLEEAKHTPPLDKHWRETLLSWGYRLAFTTTSGNPSGTPHEPFLLEVWTHDTGMLLSTIAVHNGEILAKARLALFQPCSVFMDKVLLHTHLAASHTPVFGCMPILEIMESALHGAPHQALVYPLDVRTHPQESAACLWWAAHHASPLPPSAWHEVWSCEQRLKALKHNNWHSVSFFEAWLPSPWLQTDAFVFDSDAYVSKNAQRRERSFKRQKTWEALRAALPSAWHDALAVDDSSYLFAPTLESFLPTIGSGLKRVLTDKAHIIPLSQRPLDQHTIRARIETETLLNQIVWSHITGAVIQGTCSPETLLLPSVKTQRACWKNYLENIEETPFPVDQVLSSAGPSTGHLCDVLTDFAAHEPKLKAPFSKALLGLFSQEAPPEIKDMLASWVLTPSSDGLTGAQRIVRTLLIAALRWDDDKPSTTEHHLSCLVEKLCTTLPPHAWSHPQTNTYGMVMLSVLAFMGADRWYAPAFAAPPYVLHASNHTAPPESGHEYEAMLARYAPLLETIWKAACEEKVLEVRFIHSDLPTLVNAFFRKQDVSTFRWMSVSLPLFWSTPATAPWHTATQKTIPFFHCSQEIPKKSAPFACQPEAGSVSSSASVTAVDTWFQSKAGNGLANTFPLQVLYQWQRRHDQHVLCKELQQDTTPLFSEESVSPQRRRRL